MIFIDTNAFMYAVGGEHPLRDRAQHFFRDLVEGGDQAATSVEVMQELMHAYLPVGRVATLDAALLLVESSVSAIWPIEVDDVRMARLLVSRYSQLGARDLIHLACCRRRNAESIYTFDRALSAAFAKERR